MPKRLYENIELTPAKVLGSTVSKILASYEPPVAASTAKFCFLSDSIFDIMNINNIPPNEFEEIHSLFFLPQS